ncbi:[citrate (pro-3S)-lyase] ligase [Fructilactobacillus florum]|uniref:[citrate (pro-3S)-lyase] ligase n=1 Tax=Fructilactobacillus florum TaxID=640331 RepID=UPI00028BF69F|nr:[citrate (pro-3S)-lyase] ligase [Fructilactobacillus florum]EKK21006.1 Citrate, pro-3S-lyase ligase [Fructilactobacillus florum 2F]
MNPEIRALNLQAEDSKKQWEDFLIGLGIQDFSDTEVSQLDQTLGLFSDGQLVATGSAAGNILKYVAVDHTDLESAGYFNRVVSALLTNLSQRGIFHVLVYTKPQYSLSFQRVGFQEIVHSETASFLETGDTSISDYLAKLPHDPSGQAGAIVMNANPFTLGHRFLVEQAAAQCDRVYVFVVSTNRSLFSAKERLDLVRAGTADLKNVIVVPGADYLVSYATFPAYFLSATTDKIVYQTTIDALIFKERIAPEIGIATRFLGTEPQSKTTDTYNQVLQRVLPPAVRVTVLPRKTAPDGQVISARVVRYAIKNDMIKSVQAIVPVSTYTFLNDHLEELQQRIKKGMKIDGN